ncbi:MAG: sigma-70 family RNA polymerase sigma factor [Marmoricola sp.]
MGVHDLQGGLDALRRALAEVLDPRTLVPAPVNGPIPTAADPQRTAPWLLTQTSARAGQTAPAPRTSGHDDAALATSSLADEAEGSRLIALVELARGGDSEAFGQLYDHYHASVYRFLYYRVGSVPLAEDLTAETFFRALRSMSSFRWQGKDFGAWLMTIARNLTTDHFKAGRTRLESTTEDMSALDTTTDGPEGAVLTSLTNEALLAALSELPTEQRECLVMRFLQGLSIAETAEVLGRSAGAVKQLQLRGVRNLAKVLPEGMR